jgi:microcystin-dependent protein
LFDRQKYGAWTFCPEGWNLYERLLHIWNSVHGMYVIFSGLWPGAGSKKNFSVPEMAIFARKQMFEMPHT